MSSRTIKHSSNSNEPAIFDHEAIPQNPTLTPLPAEKTTSPGEETSPLPDEPAIVQTNIDLATIGNLAVGELRNKIYEMLRPAGYVHIDKPRSRALALPGLALSQTCKLIKLEMQSLDSDRPCYLLRCTGDYRMGDTPSHRFVDNHTRKAWRRWFEHLTQEQAQRIRGVRFSHMHFEVKISFGFPDSTVGLVIQWKEQDQYELNGIVERVEDRKCESGEEVKRVLREVAQTIFAFEVPQQARDWGL